MTLTCNIKLALDTPDTWAEMQRLIDETTKSIDVAYGIDADFDASPTASVLEIMFINDSLEKIETLIKKIREACGESKHELHVKIHRGIGKEKAATETVKKTIQNITKKYLENLAERGVLTEKKAATETAKEVKLEIWDGANWGRCERSTNTDSDNAISKQCERRSPYTY